MKRFTSIVNILISVIFSSLVIHNTLTVYAEERNNSNENKTVFGGHAGVINSTAFSNDGQCFATAGDDNNIIIWTLDGKVQSRLYGHENQITEVLFTPDGKMLVSADDEGVINTWSVSKGKLVKKLDIKGESISISPDGKYLVTGYRWENTFHFALMELSTGKISEFNLSSGENDGAISSIRFSPDGERIIVAIYNSGRVLVLDKSGDVLESFNIDSYAVIIPGTDNNTFYSGEGKEVTVRNGSGSVTKKFKRYSGEINCLDVSRDGRYLASGSKSTLGEYTSGDPAEFSKEDDNSIKIWDAGSGQLLGILKGHKSPVTCIAFSHDGKYLISGSEDETVKLWNIRVTGKNKIAAVNLFTAVGGTGENIPEMKRAVYTEIDDGDGKKDAGMELVFQNGHNDTIIKTAVSPDGELIAAASADHTVSLWNRSGVLLRKFKGHSAEVIDVKFTPDGEHIVSAGGNIILWTLDGSIVKEFISDQTKNGYQCISVSPDGKYIAAGVQSQGIGNCHLLLWNIKTGEIERFFSGTSDSINCVNFSPDGKYIICGGMNKTIHIWRTDGTLIRTHSCDNRIFSAAFSPDGKKYMYSTVLPYTKGGELIIRKTADGSIYSSQSQRYNLSECIFSPDGKTIAAVVNNKTIGIYNITNQKDVVFERMFPVAEKDVLGLSFSPDGQYLVCGSSDQNIRVWDLSGNMTDIFKSASLFTTAAAVSSDGKYLAQGGVDNTINLWETGGKYSGTFTYPGHEKAAMYNQPHCAVDIKFSPDGAYLVARYTDQAIRLWKKDGTLVKTFNHEEQFVVALNFWFEFTPDGKQALIWGGDGLMYLIDLQSGDIVHSYRTSFRNGIVKIGNNGIIFAVSIDTWDYSSNSILVYNMYSDELQHSIECGSESAASALTISKNGNIVCAGLHDGTVILWNYASDYGSEDEILRISTEGEWVYSVEINENKQLLLFSTCYGIVELWDFKNKKQLMKFDQYFKGTDLYDISVPQVSLNETGNDLFIFWRKEKIFEIWNIDDRQIVHSEYTDAKSFQAVRGRYALFNRDEPVFEIWYLNKKQSARFMAVDKSWLLFTPDGYWDGSKNAGRYIAMVKKMDAFGIDQFAIRNNRPDIILERLGLGTPSLQAEYYKQYQKRIKKLEKLYGIKESDLSSDMHVPKAEILKADQSGKKMNLSIKLSDSEYDIVSYNIYVNDVPLYTEIGKKIDRNKELAVTETIELSAGENKIEVSCFNEKGAESYRTLTYASFEEKRKGNLYFIGFGVSDYNDPSINDLRYAENDVLDLAKKFSGMKGDYDNVNIKTYTGKEVTPANIKAAKDFVKNAGVDDTVILFISGHGMHDSDEYRTYYYLTQNTDMKNLKDTAANFETVEDILAGINPRKKLFLMDTCDSGELDDFAGKRKFKVIDDKDMKGNPRTPKGIAVEYTDNRGYFDRSRYIYNDLFRRTGAVVFSSSMGGEASWEFDSLKNGAFTEAIIEGLSGEADGDKNGTVTIDELRDYVSRDVESYTKGKQHPVIDRDNIYVDIDLPVR